jgi:hypothetical protein
LNFTDQVPVFWLTQREDKVICKNFLLCCEEKTLKGESHERWGMKQDPKVFD